MAGARPKVRTLSPICEASDTNIDLRSTVVEALLSHELNAITPDDILQVITQAESQTLIISQQLSSSTVATEIVIQGLTEELNDSRRPEQQLGVSPDNKFAQNRLQNKFNQKNCPTNLEKHLKHKRHLQIIWSAYYQNRDKEYFLSAIECLELNKNNQSASRKACLTVPHNYRICIYQEAIDSSTNYCPVSNRKDTCTFCYARSLQTKSFRTLHPRPVTKRRINWLQPSVLAKTRKLLKFRTEYIIWPGQDFHLAVFSPLPDQGLWPENLPSPQDSDLDLLSLTDCLNIKDTDNPTRDIPLSELWREAIRCHMATNKLNCKICNSEQHQEAEHEASSCITCPMQNVSHMKSDLCYSNWPKSISIPIDARTNLTNDVGSSLPSTSEFSLYVNPIVHRAQQLVSVMSVEALPPWMDAGIAAIHEMANFGPKWSI